MNTQSQTLRVRNWDRWQSYRSDRGQPPWIKLHRCVMRNPEWVSLTDAQRGQLVAIWLLAADQDGVIPASPRLLQKLCHLDEEPPLRLLIDMGFLEGDVTVTPTRRQLDSPETETETETEADIDQASPDLLRKRNHTQAFELMWPRFWESYPRKRGKAKAEKAFRRLSAADMDAATTAVFAGSYSFDPDPQFTPYPATWINQRRWEDEPDPQPAPRRVNGHGQHGRRQTYSDRISALQREAAGYDAADAPEGHGATVDADGGHLRLGTLARTRTGEPDG